MLGLVIGAELRWGETRHGLDGRWSSSTHEMRMLVGNLPLGTPWPRQHERTTTCKTIDVMEWLAVAAHSNNNRWRVKMIEETRRAHRHWTAPTQFSIEGRERGIHTISKNIHRWGDVSAEATLSLINYVIIDCHASMMCHYVDMMNDDVLWFHFSHLRGS